MSMQRPDSIHAVGKVSAAAGATLSPPAGEGGRRWSCAAPAASVYTITLEELIDATERAIFVQCYGAAAADRTWIVISATEADNSFQVATADIMGAAADSDFSFLVIRTAG